MPKNKIDIIEYHHGIGDISIRLGYFTTLISFPINNHMAIFLLLLIY